MSASMGTTALNLQLFVIGSRHCIILQRVIIIFITHQYEDGIVVVAQSVCENLK